MNRFKWPLFAALLAVLMAASVVYAQVLPKNPVDWLIAKRITNSGTSTLSGAVTTGDDLTVGVDLAVTGNSDLTGDLAVGGNMTVTGNLTLAGLANFTPADVITVTQAMTTFQATGVIQPVASAGAVSFGDLGTPTTGGLLMIANIGSNNVTISETASIVSAGNVVLGAGDTVTYAYIGTKWYQFGPAGNN